MATKTSSGHIVIARESKERLEETGPLSEEDVRAALAEEGLTNQQAALLINHVHAGVNGGTETTVI